MRTIMLFALIFYMLPSFSQSNKCEYSIDKTDDFSKKRIVRTTSETLFENKAGAFWNSTLFNEFDTQIEFVVAADHSGGVRSLLFILSASDNASKTENYKKIEFLLENGNVVSLTKETNSGSNFKNSYLYWKFFHLYDEMWNLLKESPLEKIRLHYWDNTVGDITIKDKYTNSLIKVMNCLDALNLPLKPDPMFTQAEDQIPQKTENDVKSSDIQSSAFESIQPLGNSNKVSIHKQWKSTIFLDKDGIPVNQKTVITRFFDDGTYESHTLDKGKYTEKFGKYSIIGDNKYITFHYESGDNYTVAIIRLTENELEVKSQDYSMIYTVY